MGGADDIKLVLGGVIDGLNVGLIVIDDDYRVALWNGFMVRHSGVLAKDVLGRRLFDAFPDLPRDWLELKFRSVRTLRNRSFTSWRQRPYLFCFRNNRPITGDVDAMRQDCTFLPVFHGDRLYICITIQDQTEAASMQRQLDEAADTNSMLAEISSTDPLTSALNRGQIERLLDTEFHRAQETATVFTVMMHDLDHFKKVNDTYGHLAGDEVLRGVARAVQAHLRPLDLFGRYGGEEFVAVLPGTDVSKAMEIAERIRATVEGLTIVHEKVSIKITTSIGVAQMRFEMHDYRELLHAADVALYDSKHGGRNRVTAHTPRSIASQLAPKAAGADLSPSFGTRPPRA